MKRRFYGRFLSIFVGILTPTITVSALFSLAQQGPPPQTPVPPEVLPAPPPNIPPLPPGTSVIEEKQLQPLPNAEVQVPGFKAQMLSDGSVIISGGGTYQAGAPPFAYQYEVDPKSGTYTTHIVDPNQIEKPTPSGKAV